MRAILYGSAAVAAVCAWPGPARSALCSLAALLAEAVPFVLAGAIAERLCARRAAWIAYAGCGCGDGPSARSLPAAALTWLTFGPAVAAARLIAGMLSARLFSSRPGVRAGHACVTRPTVLGELGRLLPAAACGAIFAEAFRAVDVAGLGAPAAFATGALLGFTAAPCGLASVAFASGLSARAPVAAAAYLCVAGIADLKTLAGRHAGEPADRDALGCVLAATALAILGSRRGGGLLHPSFTGALWISALAFAACAVRYRHSCSARARFAPALLLAGTLAASAPPAYRATETTLTALFPGERLSFTGTLTNAGNREAVVRYAITCCRADAAPMAVRLARNVALPADSWVRVDGVIVNEGDELALLPDRATRVPAPADPFVYR